jgi:ribokinase
MPDIEVAVFGAANVDLIVEVPSLPGPGETVFGSELTVRPGGKGLNQAMAVARAGGHAAFAATVGNDPWGELLRNALNDAGVDISAFYLAPGETTGAALIQVPPSRDSAVIVAPNRTRDDHGALDRARALLASAPLTVLQLQLAGALVADVALAVGGRLVGTLVPTDALPDKLWHRLDPLVVNAAEAATLLGVNGAAVTTGLIEAGRALMKRGPRSVVITSGAAGAAWVDQDTAGIVSADVVEVADTTGAGDSTLGALALALARGEDLRTATARGVSAGTEAVQRIGA